VTKQAPYTLPKLDYDYDALEPLYSAEMLELHHDKHHAAYVEGANKALANLAVLRDSGTYSSINQLQKDLAFNLSGHVLHSIFWRNLSPTRGGGEPQGAIATAIDEGFGNVDALRAQLSNTATSIQGAGWAALCYEPLSKRLIVEQIYDHQSNLGNGSVPLLVLDMWEHAYYLQYRNEKAKWAKAFWELVDWQDVGKRFAGVSPIDLRLVA
jgi:Fe-Mn family superoxide dismutase